MFINFGTVQGFGHPQGPFAVKRGCVHTCIHAYTYVYACMYLLYKLLVSKYSLKWYFNYESIVMNL